MKGVPTTRLFFPCCGVQKQTMVVSRTYNSTTKLADEVLLYPSRRVEERKKERKKEREREREERVSARDRDSTVRELQLKG